MVVAERPRIAARLVTIAQSQPEDDVDGLSVELIEKRIDDLESRAWKAGRDATLAKVEIGRCLRVQKERQPKGFVKWAKSRWGYSQQYGTVLMFLAENHARVRALLDDDPDLPLRKITSGLKQELKDESDAPARPEHVFPVATPADIVIHELDAAELPPRLLQRIAGKVDLVLTSWPYCLGQDANGYVDCTDYVVWTRLAHAWADTLEQVLAPNGRAVINLPVDVRKNQPVPRPIVFDAFRILSMSPGLRYATGIVWVKSENGHRSNTVKRGSAVSPNAPALATGDELLLVFHKGEWNLGRAGEPNDLDKRALEWTNAHWLIAGRSDKDYPHVFPDELVARCITLFSFPGDLVADFHCGSGQVAVGALRAGRRFVGGDLNPYAVALSTRRVEAEWSKPGRAGKG